MENTKSSPRDFFLNLLSSISLYYCAVWLITLWWQFINAWYPQGTYFNYENAWIPSTMRWALASLIIVFPVYILVTRFLNKDMEAHPHKKESRLRRWLMYLTLVLAAVTIVIDLVTLLFNLLEGDFATSFILKVLAVLIVAAMVFKYYYFELRREAGKWAPNRALFRWISIAIVLVSVVGAFFVVGSPEAARMKRYDAQRVQALQEIQGQIAYYWQSKQVLPASLDALNDPLRNYTLPVDPEGRSYEYRALANTSFEVCATFSTEGSSTREVITARPIGSYADAPENWQHEAGRTCFNRTIDPDYYPPIKPVR
jgi:hypothetical protein